MLPTTSTGLNSTGGRYASLLFHIWCLPVLWVIPILSLWIIAWLGNVHGDGGIIFAIAGFVGLWLPGILGIDRCAIAVVFFQCVGGAWVMAMLGLFQDIVHVSRRIFILYVTVPLVSLTCLCFLPGPPIGGHIALGYLLFYLVLFCIDMYILASLSFLAYLFLFIARKLKLMSSRLGKRSAPSVSAVPRETHNPWRWFHVCCLPSMWLIAALSMHVFLWSKGVRGDPTKNLLGQWLTNVFGVHVNASVATTMYFVGSLLFVTAIGLFQDLLRVPRGIVAIYIVAPLVSFTFHGLMQTNLTLYRIVVQLHLHFRVSLYIAAIASCVVYLLLFVGRRLKSKFASS